MKVGARFPRPVFDLVGADETLRASEKFSANFGRGNPTPTLKIYSSIFEYIRGESALWRLQF